MIVPVLSRLRTNTGGAAAVEFMLVFPLLILLLLGSVEITRAVIAHKKVQKIAYTVDHLLTKTPAMNRQVVQDTLEASSYLLVPFGGDLTIDVSYQYTNSAGTISERWTQHRGAQAEVAARPLPSSYAALREAGFLSTHVRYAHRAAFPTLFFEGLEMSAESIVRPRLGAPLSCGDC